MFTVDGEASSDAVPLGVGAGVMHANGEADCSAEGVGGLDSVAVDVAHATKVSRAVGDPTAPVGVGSNVAAPDGEAAPLAAAEAVAQGAALALVLPAPPVAVASSCVAVAAMVPEPQFDKVGHIVGGNTLAVALGVAVAMPALAIGTAPLCVCEPVAPPECTPVADALSLGVPLPLCTALIEPLPPSPAVAVRGCVAAPLPLEVLEARPVPDTAALEDAESVG